MLVGNGCPCGTPIQAMKLTGKAGDATPKISAKVLGVVLSPGLKVTTASGLLHSSVECLTLMKET